MKNKLLITILIVYSLVNYQTVLGQKSERIFDPEEYTNIIPPSPSAYEIGKYGLVPNTHFTGAVNTSIPLYTYRAGNIDVPINLSYYSSGIKVDALESHVGLGWSLTAGGVITRIVKDEPDEYSYQWLPRKKIARPFTVDEIEFFLYGAEAGNDTESDVYMYNFMGNSGRFILNNEKKPLQSPVQDFVFETFVISGTNDLGFQLIDGDGTIYEFGTVEKTLSSTQIRINHHPVTTSWFLTKIVSPTGEQVFFDYEPELYEYINSISQQHTKTIYGFVKRCAGSPDIHCELLNDVKSYENHSNITGKKLARIRSSNDYNGVVNFYYGHPQPEVSGYNLLTKIKISDKDQREIEKIDFSYTNTSKYRVFLDSIAYLDDSKSYSFEYIKQEYLCKRLSFAQDYWGYFNNENNGYLLPEVDYPLFQDSPYSGNRSPNTQYARYGLLNKIIYPTKGYTNFEYEANTYFGTKKILPQKKILGLSAFCNDHHNVITYKDTTDLVQFDHLGTIYSSVWVDETMEPCDYTHDTEATLRVKDLSNNEYISFIKLTNNGWAATIGTTLTIVETDENTSDVNTVKISMEAGRKYELSLTTFRRCHSASSTLWYYNEMYDEVDCDLETGGLRLKKQSVYTSPTENAKITRFYYNGFSELDKSSGVDGGKGYYTSERITRHPCPDTWCKYIDCPYTVLQSNNFVNVFNSSGNNVYYKCITESEGGDHFENGGITHEYRVNRDQLGYPLLGDGLVQSSGARSNLGWDNGLELTTTSFKVEENEFIPVTKITNQYTNDERLSDTVFSYSINKNFEPICYMDNYFYHLCTEGEVNDSVRGFMCTNTDSNHTHTRGYNNEHSVCFAGPEPWWTHNVLVYYPGHPCFHHEIGDTLWWTQAYDGLNVIEYMNLSSWNYLSKKTVEEYDSDNSGKVTKTTEYIYDNPLHLQLSRVKTFDSKGIEQINQVYYPQDYDTSIFSQLIHQNMVAKPIDQRTLYNGKLQGGKLVHYNEKGQPIAIDQAEDEINTTVGFDQNQPYSYGNQRMTLTYDNVGNKLLSYKGENNMETVILWGYNYSKPIVKIENATESQVMGVLSAMNLSYAELQLLDSGALIDFISVMRNHDDLKSSMATSYTYDPMIGLTTVTDPTGRVTWYDYDDLGRLETVRDMDGKILKHMEYHFQE